MSDVQKEAPAVRVSLTTALTRNPELVQFSFWLVGVMPLIVHAWSEKARKEMLSKQVKATKGGKDARDPHKEFEDALYTMGPGVYGFPVTGIKNSIVSAAHKDKGIARTVVQAALWLDAELVSTRPALAGAICDVPLIRLYGPPPVLREDMVRVGSGVQKTATLAFRPQFSRWAARLTGELNTSQMKVETLAFLVQEAGRAYGIGEMRNEKSSAAFGSYRMATAAEEAALERHAAGQGPFPLAAPAAPASLAAE